MISVISIPQLKDNYSYAISNNKNVIIIDPAESLSISKYIDKKKLKLKAILLTHHHTDHVAGIKGLLEKIKVPVYSPNKKIKHSSIIFQDQDKIDLDFVKIKVIATPGHTLDHVVFYIKENNLLFSGDTLFRLGCGRVFEGSYKQMFNSLKKIFLLNDKTSVYCGHEYTKNNLEFLMKIFPKNKNLSNEKIKILDQLNKTESSVPFNLGIEKKLNPFLAPNSNFIKEFKKQKKLSDFQLFSYLRDLKNTF